MKNTFHTMIVPMMAPTWMYAARAPKMWKRLQSATSKKSPIAVQSTASFFSKMRQSASYTNQLTTSEAMLMPIASGGVRSSTVLSIKNVDAPAQYTIASIAMPESHVE